MTGTVAEVGERALVARIAARLGPAPPWVLAGIGDDAALVEPVKRRVEALTTDALVEGVHFDRALVPPGDIGAKALAINLSDLAAMGAAPRLALLSFGLPADLPVGGFDALVDGAARMAAAHGLAIVGGNITRSPGSLFVDVTATGVAHPRKVLRRSGGRAGDALYVTGRIGAAAAGLLVLRSAGGVGPAETDVAVAEAIARYRRPEPRVGFGGLVARNRAASACIDLSDGLADAARQIAEASGTGAQIDADAVPWHAAVARTWGTQADADAAALASDDYELLFAVPERRRRAFEALTRRAGAPEVTRIGRLTKDREMVVRRGGRSAALPAGYAHFAE